MTNPIKDWPTWVIRAVHRAPSGRRPALDRKRLAARLPPAEYSRASAVQQLFDEVSLPNSLPVVLRLDQEAEYLLCREVARHALGSVPEPDDLPE